jgi:divalent metal cation (Fe/Co/Zn/Cd) transporter
MNLPVGTLVLRRKQLQASKRERAIVAVVGILLLIASLIFLFLGAKDWFAFTKELWQETAPSRRISLVTEFILVLLVGLLAHWSRRRSKEHEQLALDASGIHYA